MGTAGLAACIALLGAALGLPAAAQAPGSASGAATTKGFQMVYALEIGGKTGLLNGVTGLPSVAPSSSGAPPPAGAKTPMGPATLTLNASHALPGAFYDWVRNAVDGKPVGTTIVIRGADTSGRVSQAAMMSDASVVEVGFPALDASSNAAFAMDVKTHGVLRIEPAPKSTAPSLTKELGARMASMRWLVSGYRFAVGKLDMSRVSRIEAFTLKPGGALQLELTTSNATTQALEGIAPRAPVKGQKPPPPPPALDGQIQLVSTAGQVLATIMLHDVAVTSLTRAPGNAQTGAAVSPGHATLAAKQARITFAPMIAQ
jgi:hypothetical protein